MKKSNHWVGCSGAPDWFGSFVSELPRPLVLFPTIFFFIILFLLSIIKIIRFLLSWDSIRFFMYKGFYELMGFARWWVVTKKGICICLHTFIYYIMYVFIYMHVLRQCTTFNNISHWSRQRHNVYIFTLCSNHKYI